MTGNNADTIRLPGHIFNPGVWVVVVQGAEEEEELMDIYLQANGVANEGRGVFDHREAPLVAVVLVVVVVVSIAAAVIII